MLDLDFGLQPMAITPFPHQAKGFLDNVRDLESGLKSICNVWTTGSGKTTGTGLLARWCIEEHGGRVLHLAHREELLNQCADDYARVGVDVLIEQAGQNAKWGLFDPKCIAASVQTLQGKRLRSWPRDHFKLIITDECHHSVSESYRKIYQHFIHDWHVGVSAGIDRLDGEDLGQVYQKVSSKYPYTQAVREKQIVRAAFEKCRTGADLSKIKTTGRKDFTPDQIEEAITPHIAEMSRAAREFIGHRRMLGFGPCVGSAVAFASAFNSESIGVPSVAIHGDTQDRDAVWDDFRHGKYRVVWNCNVAIEGTDLPFVSGSILTRATKSRNLYAQMVGRTLRKFPGKEYSLNIDFHWQSGIHELAGPTSLVDATEFNSDILYLAEEMISDGKESDLMLAIERAEKVHRRRVEYKIRVEERKARFECLSYDPLAAMEALDLPVRRTADPSQSNRPSPDQIECLKRFGVVNAERLGRHRAGRLLSVLIPRASHKPPYATWKQVRWMIALGLPGPEARSLSKAAATAWLDENKAKPRRAG